jgi:hypothetical protein
MRICYSHQQQYPYLHTLSVLPETAETLLWLYVPDRPVTASSSHRSLGVAIYNHNYWSILLDLSTVLWKGSIHETEFLGFGQ